MNKKLLTTKMLLICTLFCTQQIKTSSNTISANNHIKTNISDTIFIVPCTDTKTDKCCNEPSVFNACDELKNQKIRFFEQRCEIYKQLNLTQEQRIKAKTIDEKFFDDIAPLKLCYNQEKAKLKDMQCKKNCRNDIKCQKEKIKDLKAEIKDKKKQHKKCFEKLLNDCQRKNYKKITKNKAN